jgi:hypothetical protein
VGKILVDKQPEGTKSPNLADSVMINYAPMDSSLDIWAKLAGAEYVRKKRQNGAQKPVATADGYNNFTAKLGS